MRCVFNRFALFKWTSFLRKMFKWLFFCKNIWYGNDSNGVANHSTTCVWHLFGEVHKSCNWVILKMFAGIWSIWKESINKLTSFFLYTYFGRFEHILSYGVIRFFSCEMLVQSTLIGCSFLKELLLTGGQLFSQQCHQSTLLQNFYRIWLNIGKGYQIECLLLMNT